MLIQFTVENFRSIKKTAVISFAASRDDALESYLLHPDNRRRLIPLLTLYGANGAGKTNLLDALRTMKEIIAGDTSNITKGQPLPYEPFAGSSAPTSFDAAFYCNGVRYNYGFTYDAKKIHSEHLYKWPQGRRNLIYLRNENQFEFHDTLFKHLTLGQRTPENKLYLVLAKDEKMPETQMPYRWFSEKLIFPQDQKYEFADTISYICKGEKNKKKVLKMLNDAGLDISNIMVNNTFRNEPTLVATHSIKQEDGTKKSIMLPMEKESLGVKAMVSKSGRWLKAFEEGSFVVEDNIEEGLHPLLMRHIIKMIGDKNININGGQILCTTQDTDLLNLDFLRKDQMWFVEKNKDTDETEITPVFRYKPRKRENMQKYYFDGRYGATPFIKQEGIE